MRYPSMRLFNYIFHCWTILLYFVVKCVEICVCRKERNKMHARQTRNRKKMFTSKMQETIQLLERKNLLMHFQLQGLLRNLSGIPTESNVCMITYCMFAVYMVSWHICFFCMHAFFCIGICMYVLVHTFIR